jgi:arylsulfatase A-like enzyme
VFVLSGPRAARGTDLGRHSVLDIAPTTLALLAVPIARDLDGKVLSDALAPEARSALNLTYVETFGVVDTGADPAADTKLSARTMQQLRELGYVE